MPFTQHATSGIQRLQALKGMLSTLDIRCVLPVLTCIAVVEMLLQFYLVQVGRLHMRMCH